MKKSILLLWLAVILLSCSGCGIVNSDGELELGKKELYCNEPYQLIGDSCVYEEVVFAVVNTSYYCESSVYNERLVGNKCVWTMSTPAQMTTTCPIYYSESGSRCRFMFGRQSSSCNRGYKEWNNRCYQEYVYPTSSGYTCIVGRLSGTQCIQEYSYNAFVKYTYSCPSGYTKVGDNEQVCSRTLYEVPIER